MIAFASKTKTSGKLALRLCIFLVCAALMVACQSNQGTGSAENALQNYFAALNAGQYEKADRLFGGGHDILTGWNPDIDPGDHVALWEAGCFRNGLQCLRVRSFSLKEHTGDIYLFTVEFTNPDGSLFVRGPCCGADETEMPSTSKFEVRVQDLEDGKYLVLDLPVYIP
jgi:hypothetical protein